MKHLLGFIMIFISTAIMAQGVMTPELLWSVGRVSGAFVYNQGKAMCYTVTVYDIETAKGTTYIYSYDLTTQKAQLISKPESSANSPVLINDQTIMFTQDGKKVVWNGKAPEGLADASMPKFAPKNGFVAYTREVKIDKTATDYYPMYSKTSARIYDDLMYRHWDTWEDGLYNHIFISTIKPDGSYGEGKDIMPGEAFNAPTAPFGGSDDYAWSHDEKVLAYVSHKKKGKDYALSTNTDIYLYDVQTQKTTNFTQGMMGYDKSPAFASNGLYLSWTSMPRDGYEADKNSLWVADLKTGKKYNLMEQWDGTVNDYMWSPQSDKIYFTAPMGGVIALFEAVIVKESSGSIKANIRKITNEIADFNHIVGISASGDILCHRTTMNRAVEIYSVNPKSGVATQITKVNDQLYETIKPSKVESRKIATTDGKEMFTWVVYPPDFDPNKKYPTLLYCQGGPQSALTQFYSFRWNMQLMAAQGYIVVAPNRRGMPGHGQAWNEAISGDWGGQPIRDYLSAIDAVSKESYVDKSRLGAVGASYGGYSVYMLAGVHNNRFKTFISHCGLFNMESWYGTTEELFFANFDLKGAYWDKQASASYTTYNPIKYIDKWNTPIMIIEGEKDYRVPYSQGLEAYNAAQLKGLKSRLLIFPDEGHWVTKPHNSLVWHNEFFRWLSETL